MDYKYVFIGAGPATLFAVNKLIEYGETGILIIDKGKSPKDRIEKDNLYGFGGAGTFSDFKCVFNRYDDVLTDLITEEDRTKYYNQIQDIITKFHPKSDLINKSLIKPLPLSWESINLIQSDCWHVGSTYGKELLTNMYEYFINAGVTMLFETELVDAIFKDNIVKTNSENESHSNIKYEYLSIAVGKPSAGLINKLYSSLGKKMKNSSVNVGGRFECQFNDNIKELSDIQYDFKITKKYPNNVSLRTFCVNHSSSYVVQEEHDNFTGFNGHAYGLGYNSKTNGLTNFGILAEIKNIDVSEFNSKFFEKLNHPYIVKGSNSNGMTTSLPIQLKEIDIEEMVKIYNSLHPSLGVYFKDFIYYMDELFTLKDCWNFFIPEIKINKGMVDVDGTFKIKELNNVSWVGDSCVASNSIVRAAVSGMVGIDTFLNKGETK